ncbi:hypothetical protein LXL04_023099, partial [Taraxacum kok-saghyz]
MAFYQTPRLHHSFSLRLHPNPNNLCSFKASINRFGRWKTETQRCHARSESGGSRQLPHHRLRPIIYRNFWSNKQIHRKMRSVSIDWIGVPPHVLILLPRFVCN